LIKEPQVFFDVVLHLGTLLAVIVFFRADISNIFKERDRDSKPTKWRDGIRLLIWIIVGSIPTGLMGILFKDWFESLFTRPKIVGRNVAYNRPDTLVYTLCQKGRTTAGEDGMGRCPPDRNRPRDSHHPWDF